MSEEIEETENSPSPEPESKKSPSPVLVVFLILPLLGIIGALLMVANNIRSEQNPDTPERDVFAFTSPSTLMNNVAPEFTLNDLNGELVSLSDYRGKILFLNFWQTTCPPCIEEMPDFIQFMHDQPDDVTWLTVNFDEDDGRVREFFAAYDFLGIPTVMDYDSDVRYQYGVFGAPMTFILDTEGVIQQIHIGQLYYEDMEAFTDAVRNGT